jgi:signal transduction histidine kinase
MRYFFLFCCLVPLVVLAQRPAEQLRRLKQVPESERPKIYLALSQIYMEQQPDSAVHYANEGMRLAQKRNDPPAQAGLLLQLGRINALHHHDLLAKRFYQEALGIYRGMRDAEGTARCDDALGQLEGAEKKVPLAAGELDKAARLYAGQRDSSSSAEAWEELGKIYAENDNPEKALQYYQKALAFYERRRETPAAYFVVLENMSNLYQKKGDSAAAMRYLDQAVRSSRQRPGEAEVHLLNEEGLVLEQDKDPLKALAAFKEALADARKYQQPEEQAEALIHIGDLLRQQDSGASLADLKTALEIAGKLHEPQLEARIYAAMAGVYQQEKNYKEAMNALAEQHRLVDSLLNADTTKEIAAMDSSYVLESSQEKIGGLQQVNKQENRELWLSITLCVLALIFAGGLWFYLSKVRHLNEELKTSNRIKDTLFSVIGHDLKGPAGSAAQLFELMETEDFTETELREMIGELHLQTTASLELLQALFEWGKAQLQGVKVNPSHFDPAPVVERCIHLLSQQAAQKNIIINNELPPHLQIYADADHFELVIRNLVSNAIKFTHPQGHIEVGAEKPGTKELIFYVSDSGIGISAVQQQAFQAGQMQVSFGTGREKGSGLGLLLVRDFVKANHGRIWLESRESKGTTFFVAFPSV